MPAVFYRTTSRLWSVRSRLRVRMHARRRLPRAFDVQRHFGEMQPVKECARRAFLVTTASVMAAACGDTKSAKGSSCVSPADGPGLPFCLVGTESLTFSATSDLAVGEAAIMAFDDNTSAIVARDALGFYALSATCPHACCTVTLCMDASCGTAIVSPNDCAAPKRAQLAAGGAAFLCPCHGSQFAADGSVLKGPALASLAPVPLRFIGVDAVVDLSRRASAADRVVPA